VGFWSTLFGRPNHAGTTPNDNTSPADPPTVGYPDYRPGDPDGIVFEGERVEPRSFPVLAPSPWSGWPAEWSTPNWDWNGRLNALVDIAWACIDRSATVLSAMPVYRTRGGRIIDPPSWMTNPDPSIYSSWHEFAKQLFRDYLMGETFVVPVTRGADGFPLTFRVVPPWLMHVEMRGGRRVYRMGGSAGFDVTDDVLHIRYDSSTDSPRGKGPLEVAGGRRITAGLIETYTREVVSNGGVPVYTLETEQDLTEDDAQDILAQYIASRRNNFGAPPVLDGGVSLKTHQGMSPRDMAMIEIAQFTESRIAVLLGVPPFIVGLSSTGSESMTYSNVSQVFDQHDRLSLRPMAAHVMGALSGWALPSTQRCELNRDEYSRPDFAARVDAYVKLVEVGVMSVEEVREAERLLGETPEPVTGQLLSKPDPEGEIQLRRIRA
jgi:HK97 family phage portal protein